MVRAQSGNEGSNRAPMRFAASDSHRFAYPQRSDRDRLRRLAWLHAEGTAMARGEIAHASHRYPHHAEHRFVVFDQAMLTVNSPLRFTNSLGTVQWVHQPIAPPLRSFGKRHRRHSSDKREGRASSAGGRR